MTSRRSTGTAAMVRAGDVIGFRIRAHHLTDRQPADRLCEVAGACAVQNSPPGSALLALHARVEGMTQKRFDHLVGEEKSLLQTWCMRGAPFSFPTIDAPVFTAGVLDLTAEEIGAVLSKRQLAINELGRQLAERIAGTLPSAQRKIWQALGPYAADQPLGEAVVHFCIRLLALRGIVCLAPRSENKAPFVLLEDWLGAPLPQVDPDDARAALLRRYLHCYGPSTRVHFAAWIGVDARDVEPWWRLLEDELTPVEVDARRAWLLADDLDILRSPPQARGVRLLPPRDPYTQMRDRDTIVAQVHHREVWRTVGEPGAVLADGLIVGTWRTRKRDRRLSLTVRPFRPLRAGIRGQLREEADRVADLRGASTVQVELDDAAQ